MVLADTGGLGQPGVVSGELSARLGLGGVPVLAEVMAIERPAAGEMRCARAPIWLRVPRSGRAGCGDGRDGIAYATLTDAIGVRTHASIRRCARPATAMDGRKLVSDHRPVDTDHSGFRLSRPSRVWWGVSLALSLEDQGVDKAGSTHDTAPAWRAGLNARADLVISAAA